MKSYKYLVLFLSIILSQVSLNGEIISEGSSIRELFYAKNLNRTGFQSQYSFEYISNKQDSTLFFNNHYLNFTYGFIDNFNFVLKVPFYKQYWNKKNVQQGLGDTFIALKYNFDNTEFSNFEHGIITSISLPTGNDQINNSFQNGLSLMKKEYQLMYLVDYRKDSFSIHANFGYKTLDHFQLEVEGDMSFSYKFGALYRLFSQNDNNLWIKWEFTTTHSLCDYTKYISGSQFLSLSQDLALGLSFDAGVISELYRSNAIGYRVGLSYSTKGNEKEREKKLFEKYGENINLGLIEFLNEDTTKTLLKISDEIKENCLKSNRISLTYYDKSKLNLFKNITTYNSENYLSPDTLIMQGNIVKSGFKRGSFFFIPLLINFPKISYNIDIEILVYDTNQKKFIFDRTVSDEASIGKGVKFFNLRKDDKRWFLTASEENRLKKESVNNIVDKVLENLSNKFE